LAELLHRLPSGHRSFGAVVHAADAILANRLDIHSFDGGVIQMHPRRHHQIVVTDAPTGIGDDGIGVGLKTCRHFTHPFNPVRMKIGVAIAHLAHGPNPGRHQRVTGLVVVFFLAIQHRDARAIEQGAQARRHRDPAQTAAGNHNMRGCFDLGLLAGGQTRCRQKGKRAQQQKIAAAGIGKGFFHCHLLQFASRPCLLDSL